MIDPTHGCLSILNTGNTIEKNMMIETIAATKIISPTHGSNKERIIVGYY